MPSLIAYKLRDLILSESIDSVQLEAILSEPSQRAGFMDVCSSLYTFDPLANYTDPLDILLGSGTARALVFNSPAALRALANSASGTELLVKSSNGVTLFASILRDKSGKSFSHWRDYQNNYNALKKLINITGSKLKRQIFFANGTWTYPGATVLAMSGSIWGGGAGGTGNSGATTDGASSTFMSITSAGGGRPNGGGTTVGGYASFTDLILLDSAFQINDCSQKGGDGGTVTNYTAFPFLPGGDGGDGFPGSGGRGFIFSPSIAGTSGGLYGGGGGGAIVNITPGNFSPAPPPANSGGGGGAYQYNGSTGRGGGGGEIKAFNLDAPPSSNQLVTVGLGGNGGVGAQNGAAGGLVLHWLEA